MSSPSSGPPSEPPSSPEGGKKGRSEKAGHDKGHGPELIKPQKQSFFGNIRSSFLAGIVVVAPIGITRRHHLLVCDRAYVPARRPCEASPADCGRQ